jgi:hypothetical protein
MPMAHSGSDRIPDRAAPRRARVALERNGHRWVFKCTGGDETALFERLAELARDPDAALNWSDAAVVRRLIDRSAATTPPSSFPPPSGPDRTA